MSFEKLRIDGYFRGYYTTQMLENKQTIAIFFLLNETSRGEDYSVILAIANKRKHIKQWINQERDVLSDKSTGECGLEGLFWAKKRMLEFEEFISHKENVTIYVYWTDNRRRRVYEYGLGKIGYKIGYRFSQKCLCKKVVRQ